MNTVELEAFHLTPPPHRVASVLGASAAELALALDPLQATALWPNMQPPRQARIADVSKGSATESLISLVEVAPGYISGWDAPVHEVAQYGINGPKRAKYWSYVDGVVEVHGDDGMPTNDTFPRNRAYNYNLLLNGQLLRVNHEADSRNRVVVNVYDDNFDQQEPRQIYTYTEDGQYGPNKLLDARDRREGATVTCHYDTDPNAPRRLRGIVQARDDDQTALLTLLKYDDSDMALADAPDGPLYPRYAHYRRVPRQYGDFENLRRTDDFRALGMATLSYTLTGRFTGYTGHFFANDESMRTLTAKFGYEEPLAG